MTRSRTQTETRDLHVPFAPHRGRVLLLVLLVQAMVIGIAWFSTFKEVRRVAIRDAQTQILAGPGATLDAPGTVTIMGWATGVSLSILGLTACAVFSVIRRHQRQLEQMNSALATEVAQKVNESVRSRSALIFGLAKLADYRDTDTGKHLERICAYSALLADELRERFDEIDDEWIENLRLAASLHDIGKVGIPDRVLLKPGALTPDERRQMQRHTMIGADTLILIRRRLGHDPLVDMAVDVAIAHHERWDGRGYPYGLKGEQIGLAPRIVALADVYDALTSVRVYKEANSHEEACSIILAERGRHFDPDVCDAFERLQDRFDEARKTLQADAAEIAEQRRRLEAAAA